MESRNLIEFIGVCGAFCKTCLAFKNNSCKGCKLGYDNGKRDISKAKCRMKICCVTEKRLNTCADCEEFENCETLNGFYSKNGYKYKQYKKALEYIRMNDYETFLKYAVLWKNAYGKLS